MDSLRRFSVLDNLLAGACRALATLTDSVPAGRPTPGAGAAQEIELSEAERRLSGALMRVNHVGEICAQALYEGQAASTADPRLKEAFLHAAREESDHLAWTRARLDELGASPSLLNPLWYAGSLAMGLAAGRAGDRWSLGFMAETERQVEAHLGLHLEQLPPADTRSRQIVEAMQRDEMTHARRARDLGGAELPAAVRQAMRASAKVMTTVAHRI
jgi:ubiquinone biosynthesis monooxygenase Coq7